MQISARFVKNWHYSVKQWHTLTKPHNSNENWYEIWLCDYVSYEISLRKIGNLDTKKISQIARFFKDDDRNMCYENR